MSRITWYFEAFLAIFPETRNQAYNKIKIHTLAGSLPRAKFVRIHFVRIVTGHLILV